MKLPAINLFPDYGPIRYVMAPMSGITDTVFRSVIRRMGAQVVISDLISAEGITRGGQRTWDMLKFSEDERPLGIQLFGGIADSLVKSCEVVQEKGADFVDLNLGCPVKKVVKNGAGSAWLKDPNELGKLLTRMKAAIDIPLTIKIRTGWDEHSINAQEVVQVAYESGVSWVAVHGRTRAQGYSGEANWEIIRDLAQSSPLPIIGNGDILSAEMAQARIDEGYSHAVMIGRGALKNPWIFREIAGQDDDTDFLSLIDLHFDLALERKERHRAFLSLKKFMGWYAAGLPNASQFRQQIFSTGDVDKLRDLTVNYFQSTDPKYRQTDRSAFLMGGHG